MNNGIASNHQLTIIDLTILTLLYGSMPTFLKQWVGEHPNHVSISFLFILEMWVARGVQGFHPHVFLLSSLHAFPTEFYGGRSWSERSVVLSTVHDCFLGSAIMKDMKAPDWNSTFHMPPSASLRILYGRRHCWQRLTLAIWNWWTSYWMRALRGLRVVEWAVDGCGML